jgi:hypothetical protein
MKNRELFLRKNNLAITAAVPVGRKQLNCAGLSIFPYQGLVARVIGKEIESNKKHWCSPLSNRGITYKNCCSAFPGFIFCSLHVSNAGCLQKNGAV